ncbi:MAG TPA: iron-sulfur cluster assembly scaffold protein [Blastocatellia bacterium]|nr:iron-sulfur cluster assembly scaffold protein [Blastocatellia bacterium]
MYSKEISDHIANPRNVGEIHNASGVGDVTNEVCLDRIKLTIRVEGDHVTDARVRAQGCPPTLAAASALTELIIGRSLQQAGAISTADITTALGRLPAAKKHCAVLAVDALRAAVLSCGPSGREDSK